jgi:predicted phosphate transport protein (TIGR00153 family)
LKKKEIMFFRHANKSIELIEDFLNLVDQGAIIFKEGVKNYLYSNRENFQDNLKTLSTLETEADILKRKAENLLYTQSLMPQLRGDILKLLEELDNILDIAKSNLFQFDVEVPFIPSELNQDLIKLTELSGAAIESVVPAARAYFRDPESVKEKLHRVYLFEKEADKLADSIKRRVFQDMPQIKLSEKFHLRYFTLHIETLSDAAEKAADVLSIMAIKRTI